MVTVQDVLNDSDLEFLATLQKQAQKNQVRLANTGDEEDIISDGDVVYGILEDLDMA